LRKKGIFVTENSIFKKLCYLLVIFAKMFLLNTPRFWVLQTLPNNTTHGDNEFFSIFKCCMFGYYSKRVLALNGNKFLE
jgi:hypothetical protein